MNPTFFVSITLTEKSSASLILRSAQPCPQPPDIVATFEKPLELAHCLQSLGLWLLGHSLSTLAFARIFGDFCVSCDDPANTQVSEFLDLLTFSDFTLPFPWTIEPQQRPQHLSELLPHPPMISNSAVSPAHSRSPRLLPPLLLKLLLFHVPFTLHFPWFPPTFLFFQTMDQTSSVGHFSYTGPDSRNSPV